MVIENKRATYDYEVLETLEAGVVLTGAEAKSFYENRVNFQGSYVKEIHNEFYLVNTKFNLKSVESPDRSRKLLVHRKEILDWSNKIKEKKLAIIPLSMYNIGRYIKLKIALSKSKKEFSKKHKLKSRDIERESQRDHRTKLD